MALLLSRYFKHFKKNLFNFVHYSHFTKIAAIALFHCAMVYYNKFLEYFY